MQQGEENYHKLLLPLGGKTVLSQVIAATLASQARPIILILGHQSEQIRASLSLSHETTPHDIIIVENPTHAQGMSTSLRKGIEILMEQDKQIQCSTTQCDGALVLLGDQPLVTPTLLNQIIDMKYATGKRIIAPFYNGKRGNPVLFAADLFPELLTITGDEGARSVIKKHRAEMGRLDVDDARLWYDVDTWEGYQEVLRIWKQKESSNSP